eukprot:scaffold15257_cov71-Skeletonema_dohrnii-CCMP3373.AAC.1
MENKYVPVKNYSVPSFSPPHLCVLRSWSICGRLSRPLKLTRAEVMLYRLSVLVNFESVPLSLHASISVNLQPIKPPVGRAFRSILSAPDSSSGRLNRLQIDRDRGRAKIV